MRKFFWMILLLGGYIWIVTSGHEDLVLHQGKVVYQAVVNWFEDAEVDFQLKPEKIKKKSRRWD